MIYTAERYKNRERFNAQYQSIYRFLSEAGELDYNEHFHWGRFEWMQAHAFLDEDRLTGIVMFRDENNNIAGLITYDTDYDDRTYLIHKGSEGTLLEQMIDTVLKSDGGGAVIKVNTKDAALCAVLRKKGFGMKEKCAGVLSLDLSGSLEYRIPESYKISPRGFSIDPLKYQLVIHREFDNDGIPEKWDYEFLKRIPHANDELKTFAISGGEYRAHCGLWYESGDTAYIEPVATLPEHRNKGLAKAVVYEACLRAKALGAKRAIVLSDNEFYFRIGFRPSSEVYSWRI